MNNKIKYKEIKVTQKQVGQWATPSWLRRLGLYELVMAMMLLSGEYGFKWADDWVDFLDDPKWLKRAVANTYRRLSENDQELIGELYADWCWCAEHLDLETAAAVGFIAEVVLLDRNGNRVTCEGRPKTVLVNLEGASREEALCQLNRDTYAFERWWN